LVYANSACNDYCHWFISYRGLREKPDSCFERAFTPGLLTILTSLGQIRGGVLIGAIIAGSASPAIGYQNTFIAMVCIILFATLSSYS
jgi:hypothetical protein